MRIALKVDVASRSGVRQGLPAILDLLDSYDTQASFFISPDVFTGLSSWLDRSARSQASKIADRIKDAGHDLGLLPVHPQRWQEKAAHADAQWTAANLQKSIDSFHKIFGERPTMFAAPGWQLNQHLLQLEESQGFDFASDVRGKFPFLPELLSVGGRCPQIPTTLPTLNEMLAMADVTEHNVHEYLYAESRYVRPAGHVYSASAETEGIRYLSIFEKLLVMWRGQDGSVRSLTAMVNELQRDSLPVHQVGWECPQGATQHQAVQSVSAPP